MTLWHQSHQTHGGMCGSRSHRPGSLSMNHLEHMGPSMPHWTLGCWHCWSHPHWLQDRDHLGSKSNYIDLWSLWLTLVVMMSDYYSDYDVNACVINLWSSDGLGIYDYIKESEESRVGVTCDLTVNMSEHDEHENMWILISYQNNDKFQVLVSGSFRPVSGKTPYGVDGGAAPSTTFASWIRNCVTGLPGPRCGALRTDPVPRDSSSSMYSPWMPKLKLCQSNSTSHVLSYQSLD